MTTTPIRLVVTVQFVRLLKGFWGFIDADGNKWRAAIVPEALQKEGLKAEIMAIPLPDVFSIYMWGTEIEVQSYSIIS